MACPSLEERFVGSLLGLALGDSLGAPHEGGPVAQAAWWLLGLGKRGILRWTDDTQMALVLARSLAEKRGVDPDDLARRWAEALDPRRGYGPGTRKLLGRIRGGEDWRAANRAVFPEGSFGNGAAMRSAPLGLFFHRDLAALEREAALASSITHAHPLGIEGGVLIALAAALALEDPFDEARFVAGLRERCARPEIRNRLELAGKPLSPAEVRKRLGCGVLAHESAVTAIHAFLRHRDDFLELQRFVVELGGDTDTIGAMAGGIFGAHRGASALPGEALARLEARDEIERAARELYRAWEGCPREGSERGTRPVA
ncbi:MAG: ADP-ribosylglycohydrolase family protein [Planctomycetes bacterium]|nr:ADP-ribosylglycohydrolase family protein [Planctomycetota bacterium]